MCCRVSYCCLFCGTVSEGSRSVGLVTAAFNLLGLAVGIVRGNVLASAYFGIMAAAGGMLAVGAVGRRRSSGEGFFVSRQVRNRSEANYNYFVDWLLSPRLSPIDEFLFLTSLRFGAGLHRRAELFHRPLRRRLCRLPHFGGYGISINVFLGGESLLVKTENISNISR